MRGIKSSHLKLLMTYIYQGEVEVGTEDFKDFLAVVGELEVKGLTTDDTSDTLLEKQASQNNNEKQQEKYTLNEHQIPFTIDEKDKNQPESAVLVKQEDHSDSSYNEETQDAWTLVDSKSNVFSKVEATYSCDFCGKPSVTQVGLKQHKYRYHSVKMTDDLNTTAAFECKICGRKSVSKRGLHKHNIRHHSNI